MGIVYLVIAVVVPQYYSCSYVCTSRRVHPLIVSKL